MRTGRQVEIFCIAGDPGGATALVPVIKLLQGDPAVNLHLYPYFKAEKVFDLAGLACEKPDPKISESEAAELLVERGIDLLLTGTSVNLQNLEKALIGGAKKAGVPSLAVLDFWSNYAARFSKKENDLACLADKLAVMDRLAFEEMTAAGFPVERLAVTGQPAFDDLLALPRTLKAESIKDIRHQFMSGPEDLMVAFVSQPISSMYDKSVIGYDEKDIFHHLLAGLEEICHEEERKASLVFFPHLRERETWWVVTDSNKVDVVTASGENFRNIVMAFDLVAGITSTKLVEAALMGRRTISLQIGAVESSLFDIQRLGVPTLVTEATGLAQKIRESLSNEDPGSDSGFFYQEKKAAENVVELILDMVRPIWKNLDLGDQEEDV